MPTPLSNAKRRFVTGAATPAIGAATAGAGGSRIATAGGGLAAGARRAATAGQTAVGAALTGPITPELGTTPARQGGFGGGPVGGLATSAPLFGGQPTPTSPYQRVEAAARAANLPGMFGQKTPILTASFLDDKGPGYKYEAPPHIPTGAEVYGNNLRTAREAGTPGGGLMTNEQAAQFTANAPDAMTRQGYWAPRVTVGGAFGQQRGDRVRFNAATGRYEGSQLGAGGYQDPQAMAASQFQGATPAQMTSPSGQVRAAFRAPDLQETKSFETLDRVGDAAGQRAAAGGRIYYDPTRNRVTPSAETRESLLQRGLLTPNTPEAIRAKDAQLAIMAGVTQKERMAERGQRQAGVEENAAQRQDARRFRRGNLTAAERLGFADPAAAQARAAAEAQVLAQAEAAKLDRDQRGELARGEMGLRERLGMGEINARMAEAGSNRAAGDRTSGLEALGGLVQGRQEWIDSGGDPAVYDAWIAGAATRGGLPGTPPTAAAPQSPAGPAAAAAGPVATGPAATPAQPKKTLASLSPQKRREIAMAEDPVKALTAEGITGEELDAALQELSGDRSAFREAPEGYGVGGVLADAFGLGPRSRRSWRRGRPIIPGGGLPTLASAGIAGLRGLLGF